MVTWHLCYYRKKGEMQIPAAYFSSKLCTFKQCLQQSLKWFKWFYTARAKDISPVGSKMVERHNTVLLDMFNTTVKWCTVLNPAALLQTSQNEKWHDCVAVITETSFSILFLLDMLSAKLEPFMDSSASRDPTKGKNCENSQNLKKERQYTFTLTNVTFSVLCMILKHFEKRIL